MEPKGLTVYAMNPEGKAYFRFSPLQWAVVQLFDGERSYTEIAKLAKSKHGLAWGAETMRQLGDALERGGFWYKTPQEESMALCQQLAESRHKRLTRKGDKRGDLSTIHIAEFDPDRFLTWTHSKLKWVYTTWFTALTLVMFAAMGVIFVAGWSEIWRDSVDYYKFLTKGWSDIGEFYLLFAVLAVLHETAHGITCKHFGGESHRMGAFLIYLTPGVFCDVTQVWIYGGLWQRVATMVAGTWAELILCALMTFVWWGTAAGTAMHEIAYKFMLIGGIFVVIINMNPLAKLDGYYIMSEILRIPDLKGGATAFASNWMKKNAGDGAIRAAATASGLFRIRGNLRDLQLSIVVLRGESSLSGGTSL
jgi:putative peptide zinc metalloprotease protein